MVDEIQRLKTPTFIPEVKPGEPQVQEEPLPTWEFQSGAFDFDFRHGKIMMNQQDLAKYVSENLTNLSPTYWNEVSQSLEKYRRWALDHLRDPQELTMFMGVLYNLLNRLGGRFKRKLEETIDGFSLSFEDGQLLLNGINMHALVTMVKRRPTQKAKAFLKMMKDRLLKILGNPSYDRLREVIEDLISEMNQELGDDEASSKVFYLPASLPKLPSGGNKF